MDSAYTTYMEPVPTKAEMPPGKPTPEAKPAVAPPLKEQRANTPTEAGKPADKTQDGTARSTLESIANGTPVKEATTPKTESAPTPDREKVNAMLAEANSLLLELRNMRLTITALASQAADTPLGNEMRMDTLRMIGKMNNADMPPDAVIKLDALQKQIAELKLPDAMPEQSALLPVIASYNEAHPDKAVPPQVVDQIKSGNRDAASSVAQFLQTNTDLAQPVWKELTGVEGFSGLHLTPSNVLELAKLPTTPENLAKANEMFGIMAKLPPKDQAGLVESLTPMVMVGALGLMFFTQIATGQGEGGGGH